MSEHPEVEERAEKLMRDAAAVFWENYFHKPFPTSERRPSLPSIPEKLKEKTVDDINPNSPMNKLVSSARPSTGMVNKLAFKNDSGKSSVKQVPRTLRAASLDEEDSLIVRPNTRSSVFSRAEEMKKTCSNDAYDSAKNGRAQRALSVQKRLPKLPRNDSLPSLEMTQQRAVDAIIRADIIHCRREGSLDEFDEQIGFSLSGKSEIGSVKGSSSRSHGEGFARGSISRSNSTRASSHSSKSSTPSTSRRNSLTAEAEAASFKEMIESSPALQDAIAANQLLPSFARNTISSLIQQVRSAELCAQASQLIASEKARNMKKQA